MAVPSSSIVCSLTVAETVRRRSGPIISFLKRRFLAVTTLYFTYSWTKSLWDLLSQSLFSLFYSSNHNVLTQSQERRKRLLFNLIYATQTV